jgi:hypothetical protein
MWCVVWVGVVQDVLCGAQDMVGAVHVGQCEVHRVVIWCLCLYTHTNTPDLYILV